jgi:tetratricopeptide (TPR) repeat protein
VVGNRKALLIGVENYGEGFAALPAIREDVRHMAGALEAAGYDTEFCPPEDLANASKLDATMRAFCASGGPDDVRLIYFTGHGILAEGVDWVVPAGVTRKQAVASPNQRVSTDLSKTVADSNTRLVLFVIDACRDPADSPVTKGGAGWGDPTRIALPGEHRFIRFFGCAASQVCQVIPSAKGEPASSLFTRSLAECIARGDAPSLEELLPKVEQRCAALLAENLTLQRQAPRLSCGELSGEKRSILKAPVFDPIRTLALTSVWPEFDPNKLHCLVVLSEYEKEKAPDWGLTELVRDAVAGETGDRIWNAFYAAASNLRLVSGKQRCPPPTFEPSAIRIGVFSVLDAFGSPQGLDTAVRAIAEADLVVFDVTDFEPAIMLLVGIRSACRRWLTVCSHGAGWVEGQPLGLPFNLQDLNINSHTPRASRVGPDPVVDRFVRRVETGFLQAATQPRYLDLPGYDALRQLGPHYTASSTIDPSERILVLCAYTDSFFSNWQFVSSRLKQALWLKKKYKPEIERIIDYGTPQLIRQSIYEQVRRTAACVVDWSEFSASVFLELGVRLAVSEWGAIQVIDDRYLPGGARASKLAQVDLMRRLLDPMPYKYRAEASDALERVVDVLLQRSPNLDAEANYNRIHRSLLPVIETVQPTQPPVVEELRRRADSLHHPQMSRVGAPQILFHGSDLAKKDSERTALELRIAAWLYLEHRVPLVKLNEDEQLFKSYRELGRSAIDALYDLGDNESLDLATHIEDRLDLKSPLEKSIGQEAARSFRKKGDALRKAGREEAAMKAYRSGLDALNEAHELMKAQDEMLRATSPPLSRDAAPALRELIEIYGAIGGMQQRLGAFDKSLASYAEGAILEEKFRVPTTYNRLNAVKYSLTTGSDTLGSLKTRIQAIADFIDTTLRADKSLSDLGWAWADLGDCLALLGRTEEAARAYATFIARAEIKSPERTLDVLKEITAKLQSKGDPDAPRLAMSIDTLQARLAAR